MYNILILGFENSVDALQKEFAPESASLLHITSAADFYATAFSRVFDLWLLDTTSTPVEEIAFAEILTSQNVPLIFLYGEVDSGKKQIFGDRAVVFAEGELDQCSRNFAALMRNRHEQHREKYLAGVVSTSPGISSIVTKSPLMDKLLDLVKNIAPTDSPVLLIGETGTGKELLANIFHNESRRKAGPFMAVNCGALPDNLLESELFGHERGAFTGAQARRIGKIEHAAGGTLFLDEIETMSSAMQIKLLRVLQEKVLHRLGGNSDISTDFRVIAATNTEPLELLSSGRLRPDLYYRLAVFEVNIPPLRDRTEDIPLLVQHFINRKKKDGREYVKGLDSQAMNILLSVPWFGNVRELQNVVERAVMLANSAIIPADLIHIPGVPLNDSLINTASMGDNAFRPGTTLKSFKNLLNQSAERKYLVELLDYTRGRIGEAAQLAGLTPRALYNKMKIHGLKKEDFKKSEI